MACVTEYMNMVYSVGALLELLYNVLVYIDLNQSDNTRKTVWRIIKFEIDKN